jgi:hypothetical protein
MLLKIIYWVNISYPLSHRERAGERGSIKTNRLIYIPSSWPSPGGRRE